MMYSGTIYFNLVIFGACLLFDICISLHCIAEFRVQPMAAPPGCPTVCVALFAVEVLRNVLKLLNIYRYYISLFKVLIWRYLKSFEVKHDTCHHFPEMPILWLRALEFAWKALNLQNGTPDAECGATCSQSKARLQYQDVIGIWWKFHFQNFGSFEKLRISQWVSRTKFPDAVWKRRPHLEHESNRTTMFIGTSALERTSGYVWHIVAICGIMLQ